MLDPWWFSIIISDMEEWLNRVSMKITEDLNLESATYICVDSVNMQKRFRDSRISEWMKWVSVCKKEKLVLKSLFRKHWRAQQIPMRMYVQFQLFKVL